METLKSLVGTTVKEVHEGEGQFPETHIIFENGTVIRAEAVVVLPFKVLTGAVPEAKVPTAQAKDAPEKAPAKAPAKAPEKAPAKEPEVIDDWSAEEIDDLDREALEELIADEDLDIEPEDFPATSKLRKEVKKALGVMD